MTKRSISRWKPPAGWVNVPTDSELLDEIRALVAPQWRHVSLSGTFTDGRNWMIDRIREVLEKGDV